jgi:hypothetical protein
VRNTEWQDGLAVDLPNERRVEVWRTKDRRAYLVSISSPTPEGNQSILNFGLRKDAAHALHDVLCAQLRRENDQPEPTPCAEVFKKAGKIDPHGKNAVS